VKVQNRSQVTKLLFKAGRVVGVKVNRGTSTARKTAVGRNSAGMVFKADAVIIATGGASYPATGSSGDGYQLAASAGHEIVKIRPALVPLETEGEVSTRLEGLSIRNVRARIAVDGKKQAEGFGEMFFTHFGVSGPVVLSLSKSVVDALRLRKRVTISIDLKPALDMRKLDARLLRELDAHGKKQFHELLRRLLPIKLIPVCMDEIGVSPNKLGHQITGQERKRLRAWLKNFRLTVTGYRPFTEAIITAGGVNTREVDPRTMASRRVKGLYFAGEVLDLDADTGGYNLQSAFTTGWIAGRASAQQEGSLRSLTT
jgi:predicted Rossmann fold flavoprotein